MGNIHSDIEKVGNNVANPKQIAKVPHNVDY